jgi:homoserine O-acetyltransferase
MVGPGKGIDTDRYFVICCNILGSCIGSTGPSSINPVTGTPYGLDFPMVTIGDMVDAQQQVLSHLGVTRLHSVIGGSIGGMQVLEWCVRYPDMVRSARQAIMADPNWNKGDYYQGAGPDLGLAGAHDRACHLPLG